MTLNTKECNTCHEVKSVEDFRKNHKQCKSCEAQYRKERIEKLKATNSLLTLEELRARTPTQKCSKCKETLPSTKFSRGNDTKSGLRGKCRPCNNAENNVTQTRYRKQNECLSLAELRERTPEKRCFNCESVLPSTEFYRSSATKSGLRADCRDCGSGLNSEWLKNNPEKNREYGARYRAKKRGLFWEDFNLDQIFERDGTLACAWCGELGDVVHIDHVRPLDLDGIHAPFNLVASCPSCNSSKKNMDPAVWLSQRLRQGLTGIPSPNALEAVRLAYSGIHEELKTQIDQRNYGLVA